MFIFLCMQARITAWLETSRLSLEHIWLFLQARSGISVKFTHKSVDLRIHFLRAICKKINESSLDRYFEGEQENFCN